MKISSVVPTSVVEGVLSEAHKHEDYNLLSLLNKPVYEAPKDGSFFLATYEGVAHFISVKTYFEEKHILAFLKISFFGL